MEFTEVQNINELATLASEIWHEYWIDILSPAQINYMVEKFQSYDAITNQIHTENYKYFYIKESNEIAGYIGLSSKPEYLFLSKLYIKKEFRHKGLGTKSFEFIKNYAKSLGYKKIILTVNKHNINTIKAYKKWNFDTIESVVTDIGNGFVMDDYIMEYELHK